MLSNAKKSQPFCPGVKYKKIILSFWLVSLLPSSLLFTSFFFLCINISSKELHMPIKYKNKCCKIQQKNRHVMTTGATIPCCTHKIYFLELYTNGGFCITSQFVYTLCHWIMLLATTRLYKYTSLYLYKNVGYEILQYEYIDLILAVLCKEEEGMADWLVCTHNKLAKIPHECWILSFVKKINVSSKHEL